MAELKCGVDNCSYNKDKCCCKGDIMVGGKHAGCCDDTCCESFAQRKDDSYTSSLEHPGQSVTLLRKYKIRNAEALCLPFRLTWSGLHQRAENAWICPLSFRKDGRQACF